jgi:hypothetical protein
MAEQARTEMGAAPLDVVADRGYYDGQEILACEMVGITVTLPKPMTSSAKAAGRFGEQDFVNVAADDVYRCPAGERLTYRFTTEEAGKMMRRYWTTACETCALKAQCTLGKEGRISRWEHEAVLETVQDRLDRNPDKMRVRRQTVEHPFGTIKAWMGATHFQMRRLTKMASEMALHVLAYNMKRVIQILGVDSRHARLRCVSARPNQLVQMTSGRHQGSLGSIPENPKCRSVKSRPHPGAHKPAANHARFYTAWVKRRQVESWASMAARAWSSTCKRRGRSVSTFRRGCLPSPMR